MQFCANCGTRALAGDKFCPSCGSRLQAGNTNPTHTTPEPATRAEKGAYIAGRILGTILLFFMILFLFGLVLLGMEKLANSIGEAVEKRTNR
jgi:uncharacterized membrane protein YvbJ